jgi:outer membrane protein OmpA-like peptidoglycan-associated protein
MKTFTHTLLGTMLIGSLAFAQPALSAQESGYALDINGDPVHSGSGGCVHTGAWKASMPTCPEPTLVLEEDQAKIVFALDDSEFFGFDQVKLTDQAKADLNALISAVDGADQFHGITITGHADQIGPAPYNAQLALKRAESVKNYLVSHGLPADRLLAVGDGDSQPLVSCQNMKNRGELVRCLAPNRRVDIEALLADNVDIDILLIQPSAQ